MENVEGFDKLKKAALKATKAEDIKKWEKLYEGYPDADTEVAMKALGRRLATPRFLDRYAENRTFMGKLIDTAKQMLEYLRAGKAGRLEMDELSKLIKMMDEAIIKGEVSQNEAKGESGTRYNLSQYTDHQKENWKNSKSIVVYENEQQYRDFIRGALDGDIAGKKMYFGAIPSDLARDIYDKTGEKVENYNLSLSSDNIKKIYKDHGNESKEKTRGQRAVTEDDFVYIPTVIQEPDNIIKSPEPYNGKPAVRFVKTTGNSKYTVVAVVSDKHMDLFVQTEYIGVKKGTLATPIGEQAPTNTPEASRGTDSNNSIAQKSEKSTPSAKKSHNLTEDAAEQAAREAADTADQREKDLRQREQKAAKAERDAEIKRIETRARDYNAYYYKYDDIKALIDTINKDAKLVFTDVSDAAFAAFSQLNAFRADVASAEYRKSFLETTTESLIEAADAQAGRLYSQCSPLHPLLN